MITNEYYDARRVLGIDYATSVVRVDPWVDMCPDCFPNHAINHDGMRFHVLNKSMYTVLA